MPTPKNKKWYSMKASNKKAEINIYADIGMWGITAEEFKKDFSAIGKKDDVDVHLNSYGGEVFDGFAIYNTLNDHEGNVNIIVDGIAASIASVIAMAGDTITMHKNAMLMIHNPAVCVLGEADDLRKEADVLDKIKGQAVSMYRTHATELSEQDIADLMDDVTYMTADEAKEWGFVDSVIGTIEIEEPETNTKLTVPINYRKNVFTNKIPAATQKTAKEVSMKCPKCGKHDVLEGQTMCTECARAIEKAEVLEAEKKRFNSITNICSASGLSAEVIQTMFNTGKDVSELSSEIAEEIKKLKNVEPVTPQNVSVRVDSADKFRQHAVNSLCVVNGIEKDPAVVAEVKKGEPITSLHGLIRTDLHNHGVNTLSMNSKQMVDTAFRMAGTGSSDLPAVLGDITNKNMERAYNESPVTFDKWCRIKEVPNFNSQKLIKLSNFSDIDDLPEGSNFKNKTLSDKYETVSVSTKGNTFTISRQAMVNDDMDAIILVPQKMVQAIARRQNRDVYDLLTSASLVGPTMNEDSVALFNATSHFNLIATSGIPSLTTIDKAERYLLEMPVLKAEVSDSNSYSNVPAKFLIAGTANRLTTMQVLNSVYDKTASNDITFNPYSRGIVPVFDPYLQAKLTAGSKASAWYLAADPLQMGHFVVAFLQGQRTPSLRSEMSAIGSAQGFTSEIYGDWGVGVEDYRGIIYNDGAS